MDRKIMEQDGIVEELVLIVQEPFLLKQQQQPMDQLCYGTGCHVQVSTSILHHRL